MATPRSDQKARGSTDASAPPGAHGRFPGDKARPSGDLVGSHTAVEEGFIDPGGDESVGA